MAKKAVILHGTDGKPDSNWFMWLKAKLEAEAYEVWVPQLPDSDKPNRITYGDFLLNGGWDFTDNIVIGHSSGAVEVLNLCMDKRLPHIEMAVMVSAWAKGMPNGFNDKTVFANLFPPDGFDFDKIRAKAKTLIMFHGANDPYCPPEQASYIAAQLRTHLNLIPNGEHLGSNYNEFLELWDMIQTMLAANNLFDRYGEAFKNLADR